MNFSRSPLLVPVWRLIAAVTVAGVLTGLAAEVHACGRDTDCAMGARSYRIALPDGYDGSARIGALIYVHGYRGSSAKVMNNTSLTALASKLGVAFIAAQAAGPEWNIPGVPSVDAVQGVDELAYFDALAQDLAERFAIDRKRLVVAGFSSGAMMVWHLACHRGDLFAGFVPMSGTFWEPLPVSCSTASVNLIHLHGKDDPVVPLNGRPIKDGHQGNVFKAIELFAVGGGYGVSEPMEFSDLECDKRQNAQGKVLALCLFSGKHALSTKYLEQAWRDLEPLINR